MRNLVLGSLILITGLVACKSSQQSNDENSSELHAIPQNSAENSPRLVTSKDDLRNFKPTLRDVYAYTDNLVETDAHKALVFAIQFYWNRVIDGYEVSVSGSCQPKSLQLNDKGVYCLDGNTRIDIATFVNSKAEALGDPESEPDGYIKALKFSSRVHLDSNFSVIKNSKGGEVKVYKLVVK